jgi:hypothetical protein
VCAVLVAECTFAHEPLRNDSFSFIEPDGKQGESLIDDLRRAGFKVID